MSSRLFSGRTERAAEIEPNTRGPHLAKPQLSRMPLKLSNPFWAGPGTGWGSNQEYVETPSTVKTTPKVVGLI